MANHLVGYFQSIDSASLVEINTLVDDVLTRTGDKRYLIPSEYNNILWAAALGVNLTRAQLNAPSLQVRRMNLDVVPHARGAAAFATTKTQIFIPGRPIPMTPSEELSFLAAEDAVGASAVYGLVALAPATLPPLPEGEIREVRATGTATLTANAWTTVTVTPESALEPGTYRLVGFIPTSAGCIAARAIITGQIWRPGLPGIAGTEAAARDFDPSTLNDLMFFDFGEFTHINVPQFQFLSSTADTTETVILFVIRTGAL